jgi:2-iminobutanoate/2-iminopropanoate deaminase
MKQIVVAQNAPRPIGPYSQGIRIDNFVFTSGQGPTDPKTNTVVNGSFEDQVRQTLNNVRAILTAAGTDLTRVIKVNVYLSDMNNFAAFNEVYKEYFHGIYPCRTAIEAKLPAGFSVEVDCIATIE